MATAEQRLSSAGLRSASLRRDLVAERSGVDLRSDAAPRIQVVIGTRAMRAISEETRALTRDCGVESGGWIFGTGAFRWHRRIEVSFVTGPGAKSRHASGSCELDYDLLLQRQRELDRAGSEVCYLGEWHTHPNGLIHRPSEGDLRAWRGRWLLVDQDSRLGRRRRFMPRYLGLLVAPSSGSRSCSPVRLQLSAWIVQDDERGRIVCEPAAVEKKF